MNDFIRRSGPSLTRRHPMQQRGPFVDNRPLVNSFRCQRHGCRRRGYQFQCGSRILFLCRKHREQAASRLARLARFARLPYRAPTRLSSQAIRRWLRLLRLTIPAGMVAGRAVPPLSFFGWGAGVLGESASPKGPHTRRGFRARGL